jgi:hypothetical protein
VRKILAEILRLLWQVIQLVLWKWLRSLLGRALFYVLVVTGVIALLVMIVTRL